MTREQGALMAETRLVVEHREQLWSLGALVCDAQHFPLMLIEGVAVAHIYSCTGILTHALPALRVAAV